MEDDEQTVFSQPDVPNTEFCTHTDAECKTAEPDLDASDNAAHYDNDAHVVSDGEEVVSERGKKIIFCYINEISLMFGCKSMQLLRTLIAKHFAFSNF